MFSSSPRAGVKKTMWLAITRLPPAACSEFTFMVNTLYSPFLNFSNASLSLFRADSVVASSFVVAHVVLPRPPGLPLPRSSVIYWQLLLLYEHTQPLKGAGTSNQELRS